MNNQTLDNIPEKREHLYKEYLRQARLALLNAQEIVRPYDEKWKELDELIEPIKDLIQEK